MKKNTYRILILLIFFIYIIVTNIFNFILGNKIRYIGFNIINSIYLTLILSCIIITNIIFKKSNFKENDSPKDFRNKLSESVSNSFVISTIVSTVVIILLYQFFRDILIYLNIETGIINYTIYALKIFFVSIPFLGLEITILRYFYQINCYGKIIKIILSKFLIFIFFTFILFFKYSYSSILYSKVVTDILFLYFYTKTCFAITIFKKYKKTN